MPESIGNSTKIKPGQPTQLYTFSNALLLLNNCTDQNISDSLDEFLLLHRSTITANPLHKTTKETISSITELSLHGIIYTDITPTNIEHATKLSDLLDIDAKECLRIICQVCKKIPEKNVIDFENSKTKLPDDREKKFEQDRLVLYGTRILQERRTILECALELLNKKLDASASSAIQNLGKDLFLSYDFTNGIINTLTQILESLKTTKHLVNEIFDEIYYREILLNISLLLKILVETTFQNSKTISLDIISNWFNLLHSGDIDNLNIYMDEREALSLIHGLINIVSVSLLDLEEIDTKIMVNSETFKNINDSIVNPNNDQSIVMYSWLIILLRKSLLLNDTPDKSFSMTTDQIDSAINFLSAKCKELNVFHEIDMVNKVLKFDNLYPAVLSSVIMASMPLITLTPEIASTIHNVISNCPNVIIEKFFNSPATIDAIIISRAKFPYSLTPFLKLISINGEVAFNEFKQLKSYMSEFHKDEFVNMSTIDDENTELVKTTQLIDIYPPYELNNKLSLLINKDTKAKLLPGNSDTNVLATFLYNYNGFAFLGRILQNLSNGFNSQDQEKTLLIVDTCTLLTSILKHNQKHSMYLIETLSAYTDNSDIIEIILRLLEQGLHSRNIKVSRSITDLLYYISPSISDRIWNYLSNSILLSDDGRQGYISILFNSVEMVQGDYSFTISFIKLTEILAHDCLSLKPKVPTKIKHKVLAQCIRHLILVFETFAHCKFNDSCQKMELGVLILDTFSNILTMVYGLQHNNKGEVSQAFIESAKNILDSFLVNSSEYSRTCYPLHVLIDSLEYHINLYELKDSTSYLYSSWISSVLEFSELIISIRSSINYPPSTFETMIFSKLPVLVKTYANYSKFRKNILDLMTSLTNGNWPESSKPSLLSHLGRNNSQILLQSLITDLDNDFDDYNIKVSIYDFISAVMKGNQEGLSVSLLGIGDIVSNLTSKTTSDQSLIKVLKKNIKNIEYFPDSVGLHLVDSMGLVINSWSSLHSLTGDEEFIDELINKVKQPIPQPKTVDEYIGNCYKLKLLSKIAELLAVYVFSSKKYNTKVGEFLIEFKKSMESFFTLKSYHDKLHKDVDIEFKDTFNPFTIEDFRCSLTKRNRFGINIVYNLSIMDGMFNSNSKWIQLREKIIASGVELQYLGVQVDVAKSLSALITAICRKDPKILNVEFIKFSNHLLRTNINEGLPAEFFEDLYHTRIELAFFLTYNMYNLSILNKDTNSSFELLKTSSELLKSDSMDFLNNLTNSTGHYRSLLRTIYCTLSAIKTESVLIVEYFSIFKFLLDIIINKGTKVLIIEIQNDIYLSKTKKDHQSHNINDKIEDILLMLSILKVFVEFKISANNQFEIGKCIEENGLVKSLLDLYTFSHLIEIEGDFILSQLSLMFIQELMKFDIIAKQLIDGGLFTILTNSHVSNTIKQGDINITTSPRYHRIWTNGILPILIFTLSNRGPSVLPEVCFTLGNFKRQIEFCIDSWSKDSSTIRITTATINETSQLLILLSLLKNYKVETFLGLNVGPENPIDVPVLPGLESDSKRDDFKDYITNLLKHPKFLTSRILPSSIEEQRIIETGGSQFDGFVTNLIDEINSLKEYL